MPATLFRFPSHSYLTISSSLNPKPPQTPKHTPSSNPTISNNPEFSLSVKQPLSQSDAAVKMPTAPWMNGPLLLPPHEVLDLSKPNSKKNLNNARVEKSDKALTEKIGVRGERAVNKIVRSIEKLRMNEDSDETQKDSGKFGFGDCLEQLGEDDGSRYGRKMPWERDVGFALRRMKKEKAVTEAELRLDKALLERLRGEAAKMRRWVKVKKAGVTQGVVDEIRTIWRRNELAMLKFDIPLCKNLDRAREIVEIKTGGLVVWSKKDTLVVYRGCRYQPTSKNISKTRARLAGSQAAPYYETGLPKWERSYEISLPNSNENGVDEKMCRSKSEEANLPPGISSKGDLNYQPVSGSLYVRETERLLDGLGPRYLDWWMDKPLPVDADLLPEVVPGYRPPFRLCPPRARAKLTNDELTYLRKLAHPLPTHFVLGRRGVFDGVIEGLHQHWKYREVVKVITKQRLFHQVVYTAKFLEAESGGVLVSVKKLKEGHAIILYRGKNYRRPLKRVPENLLTKREALHKSLEMQRIGSLKFFAYQRQQAIMDLKCKLEDLQQSKSIYQRD